MLWTLKTLQSECNLCPESSPSSSMANLPVLATSVRRNPTFPFNLSSSKPCSFTSGGGKRIGSFLLSPQFGRSIKNERNSMQRYAVLCNDACCIIISYNIMNQFDVVWCWPGQASCHIMSLCFWRLTDGLDGWPCHQPEAWRALRSLAVALPLIPLSLSLPWGQMAFAFLPDNFETFPTGKVQFCRWYGILTYFGEFIWNGSQQKPELAHAQGLIDSAASTSFSMAEKSHPSSICWGHPLPTCCTYWNHYGRAAVLLLWHDRMRLVRLPESKVPTRFDLATKSRTPAVFRPQDIWR